VIEEFVKFGRVWNDDDGCPENQKSAETIGVQNIETQ
jgi:hypothetical protein